MSRLAFAAAAVVTATLALASCARAPARPRPAPPEVPPALQLPRDLLPLRYGLELTVNPELDGFTGRVEIEVRVGRAGRFFWMHARDLAVRDVTVEAGGAQIPATLAQVTAEGVARLSALQTIPTGRAVIRAAFSGTWGAHLAGLYRTRTVGAAYAYTHLEPTAARRVFPCFDEPSFKAPFDIALVVREADVAVSNGPVEAQEPSGDGMKRVRFARTPPLPTYLVFAAAGPFDVVEGEPLPPSEVRSRPLPVRAVAPRGTGARYAFALQATRELLPMLEAWFGIPFPYAKLDQVVSSDFAYGGMENAGAILYAEERLAFDAGRSPEAKRTQVGGLLAHELAHQWFGDLVTLAWWDDVWLNESFATFMTWKTLAAWRPEEPIAEDVGAAIGGVMDQDALASARAIRQPLLRTSDIGNQFDALSYTKGASILRGFERLLGEERFRNGIRSYLSAHANGTGTTEAVLAALSRAGGRDVVPAFHSFLDQPGTPLVHARAVCDASGARVRLEVERYRPVGSLAGEGKPFGVPVCVRFAAGGAEDERCALASGEGSAIPLPGCPDWIMPDAGGTGPYRWDLPAEGEAALRARGLPALAPVERLSYARNVLAGARAGRRTYAAALATLAPLAKDPSRRVATSLFPALELLVNEVLPPGARDATRAWAAGLYRPRLTALGLVPAPSETTDARRLRQELARFLVRVARDPDTTHRLAQLGRAYAGGDGRFHPEAVSPDLAEVALVAAVMEGNRGTFDELARRLPSVEDSELRARILAALGSALDPELSRRALALAGDPSLRIYERARPLFDQAWAPETREGAWRTLQARFGALAAALPDNAADRLPSVAAGFCEEARVPEVQSFLAPRVQAVAGAPRSLAQTLERIALCAALRERQR